MKTLVLIVFCALIGLLVLGAGCTQPSSGPVTPSPTATTAQPTLQPTVATPAVTPTLGFIEGSLPSQYDVTVTVVRNTVATNPLITTTFRGGKGVNFLSSMDVIVSRSDGQVVTQSLEKPQVNSVIDLQGTLGTDRVEVFVSLVNGDRYRIFDQSMPFRSYN